MRILLGTSKEWFAAALKAVIEPEGFEVLWVRDRESVLRAAEESGPQAVLLDEALAGSETPDLCRELASGRLDDTVPLLLYASSALGETVHSEAYEAGVWSIFEDPLRASLLVAALRRFMAIGGRARRHDSELRWSRPGQPLDRPALEKLLPVLRAAAAREAVPLSWVAIGPTEPGAEELPDSRLDATVELCGRHLRSSDLFGWADGSDLAILAFGSDFQGAEALVRRLVEAAGRCEEIGGRGTGLSAGIHELARSAATGGAEGGQEDDEAARRGLEAALNALGRARAEGGGIRRSTPD